MCYNAFNICRNHISDTAVTGTDDLTSPDHIIDRHMTGKQHPFFLFYRQGFRYTKYSCAAASRSRRSLRLSVRGAVSGSPVTVSPVSRSAES